ncbi:MAG TPA: hypothetical protein VMZ53_23910 [Kofleriaceae bacterium]|nr:hypothetical protein [Kofleriaceae bacterium]
MATPSFRKVIEATRSNAPGDLGCVIDTALTSEAIAVAFDARVGTTIVVVTRAFVGNCPALSKLGSDRYVATVGGGSLVTDRKQSVLGSSQWEWAHDYLLTNPLAIAAELPAKRVLAVAQPDPLDGWVAIEALEPTTIEKSLNELAARWRSEGKMQLGTKLKTSRAGAQVVARLDKPDVDDMIALITDLTRNADAPPAQAPPAFACPPPSDLVKSCTQGTAFVVTSTKRALESMTKTELALLIDNGDVAGLRASRDAALVLRAGDVVLGIDSHKVGSPEQLQLLIAKAGPTAALAIRRDGVDTTVTLSESP